jgi:hypothetical protein
MINIEFVFIGIIQTLMMLKSLIIIKLEIFYYEKIK